MKDKRPRPVRLGIIGAGLATRKLHWEPLNKLTDRFVIAAVADTDEEAARSLAQTAGGCLWTHDYRDLLGSSDVEALLISLPIYLNAQVLMESVRSGKHALCEKPIASNLSQAREVVDAVRGAPVVVAIAEQFHYRRDIKQAREWIEKGRIGDLFLVDVACYYWTNTSDGFGATPWRQDSQYRGGAVTDAGVHHAAFLREVAGEPEQLQAFTKLVHPELSGIDTLVLNLRFRGGALGRLMFSAAAVGASTPFLRATLFGSRGTIEMDGTTTKMRARTSRGSDLVEETFGPYDGSDAYYDQLLNFYQAITEGAPIVSTPEEAMRDLAILMLAYESAERRGVILLP